MLLGECAAAGVDIQAGHTVREVGGGDRFRVITDRATFDAPRLVIATGGPSVPKTGATGLAYRLAAQFGLDVVPPEPALVPFTLDDAALELARPLSGVAVPSEARCGKARFRENILFTHRGLSGPAVLQVSTYWHAGAPVRLDLLPDVPDAAPLLARKRDKPKQKVTTALAAWLPQRLADRLSGALVPDRPLGDTADKTLRRLVQQLKAWDVTPSGTEGFAKAEVTRGGIDTRGLDQRTMAAKDVPGLYVIGEAVDVTGWLGGYNFQWAWSSGWCAGQAV
jgi:hypothetical protein